jgi:hypothetical protein
VRKLIVVLGVLALAGCGSATQEPPAVPEGPAPLEQVKAGNFTLYVSNQSFERATVDIRVLIDGRSAVEDAFAVENQHNWVEYRFVLDEGRHSLRAESVRGEAVLDMDFAVKGRRWAVVDYWCCNDATEPRFTFLVRRQPLVFA